MLLQLQVTSTIDMTVPFWGVLSALIFGAFHMVRMHMELKTLREEMREIKNFMLYGEKPKPDFIHDVK